MNKPTIMLCVTAETVNRIIEALTDAISERDREIRRLDGSDQERIADQL